RHRRRPRRAAALAPGTQSPPPRRSQTRLEKGRARRSAHANRPLRRLPRRHPRPARRQVSLRRTRRPHKNSQNEKIPPSAHSRRGNKSRKEVKEVKGFLSPFIPLPL